MFYVLHQDLYCKHRLLLSICLNFHRCLCVDIILMLFFHYFHFQSLNYNYIYGINVWLLLNPWWLCFDWSMGCIPTIESIADVRLVAVVILWIFIGCLVCYVARGELDHKKRLVIFIYNMVLLLSSIICLTDNN